MQRDFEKRMVDYIMKIDNIQDELEELGLEAYEKHEEKDFFAEVFSINHYLNECCYKISRHIRHEDLVPEDYRCE